MITRQDLTPGFQACQAAHAAFTFSVEYPDIVSKWHTDSNFLVVLAAQDEESLTALLAEAVRRQIRCIEFIEPDLNDELTAIVLEPTDEARRLCANLPLALREEAFV